jgi:oligoribonuclease NrnB/cAMP/cGMP phosphodiesterase (DHH superfamily)
MTHEHKKTAILYHGGCPDGFGGAYAAWKKYGDDVEYIPLKHGRPAPEGLEGRDLIFIDFSYPKDTMDELVRSAASITVLDHHLGAKETVESMPTYVFDAAHSGAVLAWNYFHPDTPTPILLTYVEDGDLYTFKLPHARAVLAYVYAQRFTFEEWDALAARMEEQESRDALIAKGEVYAEHFAILVEQIANKAALVEFEGYTCSIASGADMFASDVGNLLARERPPIGLVVNLHGDVLNVSLRSTEDADVSAIARKYGGNGHPRASAFRIAWGDPLPWKVLPSEHDHTRH